MSEFVLWLIALLAVIVLSAEMGSVHALALWAVFGAATGVYVRMREKEWENDNDAR